MKTEFGARLVEDLLGRIEHGVFREGLANLEKKIRPKTPSTARALIVTEAVGIRPEFVSFI